MRLTWIASHGASGLVFQWVSTIKLLCVRSVTSRYPPTGLVPQLWSTASSLIGSLVSSSGAIIVAIVWPGLFPKCASSNYKAIQTPHTYTLSRSTHSILTLLLFLTNSILAALSLHIHSTFTPLSLHTHPIIASNLFHTHPHSALTPFSFSFSFHIDSTLTSHFLHFLTLLFHNHSPHIWTHSCHHPSTLTPHSL